MSEPLLGVISTWAAAWSDRAAAILWQSALVFAVVWLAAKLVRGQRPALRRALWALVLVRLVMPADFALPIGIGNLMKPIMPRQDATAAHTLAAAAPEPVRSAAGPLLSPLPSIYAEAGPAPAATASLAAAPGRARSRFSFELAAFAVWLAGVLLLGAFLVRRYRAIRACARGAQVVSAGPLHEMFLSCCRRIAPPAGLRPALCTSRELASPMLVGIRRPRIILPERLLQVCSREELEALVLHELAHVRQWDLLVNCAQVALQVLHWYNPLVWLASRELRRERELCCDDRVLLATGLRRREYAAGLLKVLELTPPRMAWSLGALGVVESKATLQRRISRIMDSRLRPAPRLTLLSVVGLLIFGAIVLASDPYEGSKEGPPPDAVAADEADSAPGDEAEQKAGAPAPSSGPLDPADRPPRKPDEDAAAAQRAPSELAAKLQERRQGGRLKHFYVWRGEKAEELDRLRSEALAERQRELEGADAALERARSELLAKQQMLREKAEELQRIRSEALAERQRALEESTAELDRARSELVAAYRQLREAAAEVRRLQREMLAEHRREVQEALREVARARSELLKEYRREQWEQSLRSLFEHPELPRLPEYDWAPDEDWLAEYKWLFEHHRDALDLWLLERPDGGPDRWRVFSNPDPEKWTEYFDQDPQKWIEYYEMLNEFLPEDALVPGLPLPGGAPGIVGPDSDLKAAIESYLNTLPPGDPFSREELERLLEELDPGTDLSRPARPDCAPPCPDPKHEQPPAE